MTRRLVILRHAKSSWDSGVLSDFDRPLAGRGEKGARTMGDWLRTQGLRPDHVVTSPALRARQTAERVCESLGLDVGGIAWDRSIYDADIHDLLGVLAGVPPTSRLALLVGHNPGLEDLVRYLVPEADLEQVGEKVMPTAAAYVLDLPELWSNLPSGAGRVLSRATPRTLEP